MEVIRKYGAENVDLVIACLKGEHPDLWRLVRECERLTGKRVMRIAYCPERASGYVIHAPESYWWSIWDVFEREGRMGSSLADPCSRVLKRETLRAYILRTYPNGGAVIHVGIKPDEIDRQMDILSNWGKAGYKVEFDLCDNPDCYGLNVEKIVEQMKKGARGQRYYGLLKAFLVVRGKDIVNEFWAIKARDGGVTPVEIGYLSLKYGLNLKATWEWLEECQCVHSGMYEHFGSSGIKVRDVYEAARQKYPDLREIHAP